MSFAAPRRGLALLLLAFAASGCPALLDDDFTMVGAGSPDASGAGGRGGSGGTEAPDAPNAGTSGSAGSSGSAGAGGGSDGGPDAAGSGGTGDATTDAPICECTPSELCCESSCIDRMTNRQNCGACGMGCPGTTCTSAQCTNVCALGFLDCDHNVVNGCEVNAATDPDNCGSCGIECPFEGTCMLGRCGCPQGTEDCNGIASDGCETEIDSDRGNCGACGKSCGPNQECRTGACACRTGFGDCNLMADDGCEADFSRPETCGSCSKDCGANTTCTAGTCGCLSGFLNCDSTPGCEAAATAPQTCGSCSRICTSPTPVCNGTACVIGCGTGQTLCGGVSCVNLGTDPANCGACGRPIAANQRCVGGVPTCEPGFANCNGIPTDGCETDTRSDPDHCGSCPNACKPGAICTGSACACAASTPNDCGTSCRQCCSATHCSDGDQCSTDSCSPSGTCAFSAPCAGGGKCCGQQGCFECCGDADCTGGKVCSSNSCVLPTCTPPSILCGTLCVNPTLDAAHCGGCDNPCGPGRSCSVGQCTPKWVTTAAAPAGFVGRSRAATTWIGDRVFIWGGQTVSTALNTGALYNPQTNTWTTIPVDSNTPSARILATAVWTGSVVVVWGGGDVSNSQDYRDGGRFDPVTNTWQRVTASGAPTGRRGARGVFTGSRVLLWGGFTRQGNAEDGGSLYDAATDGWTQMETNNQPPELNGADTGWSGTHFYVYGGLQTGSNGETDEAWAYDAALDSWRQLPDGPSQRYGAFGAWDGSYFIAWGGRRITSEIYADGRRYSPVTDSWSSMTLTGAPSARRASHREAGWSARVSGGNLLVLGGFGSSTSDIKRDGAIYNSTTNAFTAIAAWPSGEQRLWAAGVWTGAEFVLWGGVHNGQPTATGERLRP